MGPMPRPTYAEVAARPLTNKDRRIPNEVLLIRMRRRSTRRGTCLEYDGLIFDGVRYAPAHEAAWRARYGKVPEDHTVYQRCDNTKCWQPLHLWTGTEHDKERDAMQKKIRARRPPKTVVSKMRGSLHAKAKLTEKQAREIKSAKDTGIKGTYLAAQHGISPELVYGIWSGRNWGWLT